MAKNDTLFDQVIALAERHKKQPEKSLDVAAGFICRHMKFAIPNVLSSEEKDFAFMDENENILYIPMQNPQKELVSMNVFDLVNKKKACIKADGGALAIQVSPVEEKICAAIKDTFTQGGKGPTYRRDILEYGIAS